MESLDWNRIYIGTSIPHIAILNRSEVRIFMTSGGFHNVQEALCANTPILAVPFSAEQVCIIGATIVT